MIYYVQTNLDQTISNVSKKYKQGYVKIDVPGFWVDRFLNNFSEFWVDSKNVLHKPGTLKPATEITTKALKQEIEEANNEIENIKSSVANNSNAFSNALDSKVDKEAINSVRDTLIAVNSQLASLPNTATKQELSDLRNEALSKYTPLVDSLTYLNSELSSKADIHSLDSYVTKEKHSSVTSELSKSINSELSSLDSKKADYQYVTSSLNNVSGSLSKLKESFDKKDSASSEKLGSAVNAMETKINSKANSSDLNSLSSALNTKINKKSFDDKLDSKADNLDVSLLATSLNVQLNTKANITYVDNKYYKLLNHIDNTSNKPAIDRLYVDFNSATSSVGSQLNSKADLSSVQSANKSLVDYVENVSNSKANISDLSGKVDFNLFSSANEALTNDISNLDEIKANNKAVEDIRENLQNQINTFNEVDSGVVKNVGAIQEQVNGKANQSDLEALSSNVNNKVDVAQLNNSLITKADQSTFDKVVNELTSDIDSKANNDALDTVKGDLSQVNNKLDSTVSTTERLSDEIAGVSNKIDEKVSNLSNDLGSKADRKELDTLNSNTGSLTTSLATSINGQVQSLAKSHESALSYVESEFDNKVKTKTDVLSGSISGLESTKADKEDLKNYAKADVQEKNSNAIEWLAGRSNQQDKNIGNNYNLIQANALFAKGIGEATNSLAIKADTDAGNIINNAKHIDKLFESTNSLAVKADTDAGNIINNANNIDRIDKKIDSVKPKEDYIYRKGLYANDDFNMLIEPGVYWTGYAIPKNSPKEFEGLYLHCKVLIETDGNAGGSSTIQTIIVSDGYGFDKVHQMYRRTSANNNTEWSNWVSYSTSKDIADIQDKIDILTNNKADKDRVEGIGDLSKSNFTKIEKLLNDKNDSTSFYRGIYSGDIYDLKDAPSGKYWLTGVNTGSPIGNNVWGELFIEQLNQYDTMMICYIDDDIYYNSTMSNNWKGWVKIINDKDISDIKDQLAETVPRYEFQHLSDELDWVKESYNKYNVGELSPNVDILTLDGPGIYTSEWGYQDTLINFPGNNGAAIIYVDSVGGSITRGKKITVVNSWGFEYVNIWANNAWLGWKQTVYEDTINRIEGKVNSNAYRIALQEDKEKGDISSLESSLESLANKPSVSNPSTGNVDLSSYVTQSDADKIAQQKMEQVYNNLNDKIEKIMVIAKPAFDMYNSSVATSNSIANSIASSVASANSMALSSSYPYVGKPFFMIGNEKVTKNQGYTSDMTVYGKVQVPGLDTSKEQTVTITFKTASHTFPGLGMYENGGPVEKTITFDTGQIKDGLTVPWSSTSKGSELSLVDKDILLFRSFDGAYSTRISGNGTNAVTNYAVIQSIKVVDK